MKIITCLIADDEPMALNLIESYVSKTPFLVLKAKCSNAVEAMEYTEKNGAVQLYFLDIQMPELSGLDFSRILPRDSKIVFTTAFDQYAVDGYKVNAIGYLLKPFDYSEFLEVADKARNIFEQETLPAASSEESKDFFFVKSEYRQVKISFPEILYIEGLKDYVKIYTSTVPKPTLTLMSLKKLEEELPSERFMRVHRSFIVALDKIQVIERNHIIIGEKQIPIATQYKELLQSYINGKSL